MVRGFRVREVVVITLQRKVLHTIAQVPHRGYKPNFKHVETVQVEAPLGVT